MNARAASKLVPPPATRRRGRFRPSRGRSTRQWSQPASPPLPRVGWPARSPRDEPEPLLEPSATSSVHGHRPPLRCVPRRSSTPRTRHRAPGRAMPLRDRSPCSQARRDSVRDRAPRRGRAAGLSAERLSPARSSMSPSNPTHEVSAAARRPRSSRTARAEATSARPSSKRPVCATKPPRNDRKYAVPARSGSRPSRWPRIRSTA